MYFWASVNAWKKKALIFDKIVYLDSFRSFLSFISFVSYETEETEETEETKETKENEEMERQKRSCLIVSLRYRHEKRSENNFYLFNVHGQSITQTFPSF